jgi:hypothetical protein
LGSWNRYDETYHLECEFCLGVEGEVRAEKVAVTRADRTSSRSGGLLPLQERFRPQNASEIIP